jgi:predicted HNH restriction endonuclease
MNIEDNEKEKFDFLEGFNLSEDVKEKEEEEEKEKEKDYLDNERIIPGELRVDDSEDALTSLGRDDLDGEVEEEYEDLTDEFDEEEFEGSSEDVISDDGYLTAAELEIVDEHIDGSEVLMDDVIYDSKGTPINSVIEGEMKIRHVALEDIMVPPRGKLFQDDLNELEESIHFWGLVEPIHLVPYKDKFMLLHGYRRLMAYQNMGFDVIPALVNSTRPKEVIRYLEVVSNNVRRYNFIEMMKIGEFIEERQKSFSHDTIENILGLPSGHYLKAKYIEAAKMQFDEIYNKVVKNKMSLEQAFKKIEKELNKDDEELTPLDHLNQFGLDYGEVVEEEHVQQSGERHPLDPALRKYVEGRDFHSCQSCGMGLGEPDLASIFHAHHIIPVKHQGADKKGNLILLCPNCHGYVHAFDEGKFKPSNEMVELYDTIHNTVVLGNIIKRGISEDIDGYDFYMKRAKQSWLDE